MSYNDVVTFLASNPLVLAVISLLALWPLVKGLATYGLIAWQWVFGRLSINRSETQLAAKSTNFLISTLAWYALILVVSTGMSGFLFSIGEGLRTVPQTPLTTGLRSFNSVLQFLAGLMSGTMIANIGILTWEVRKAIKNTTEEDEK